MTPKNSGEAIKLLHEGKRIEIQARYVMKLLGVIEQCSGNAVINVKPNL